MNSPFVLGAIYPLLVERFTGFDLPPYVERVRLLSDGSTGPHEILQSSGIPARGAVITGTLIEAADCALLRSYDATKEAVDFTDGNGNVTVVRLLELSVDDKTDWWTFTATLYEVDPAVPPGS